MATQYIEFSDNKEDIAKQRGNQRAGIGGVLVLNHKINKALNFHRKNCSQFCRLLYTDVCQHSKLISLEEQEKHYIKIGIILDNNNVMTIELERKINKDNKYSSTWNYWFKETNTIVFTQDGAIKHLKEWLNSNK